MLSPHGAPPRARRPAPRAGLAVGVLNGILITRLGILPFIATLATMLAASGAGLLLAGNQSVGVSYESGFTELGQGDFLGFPIPAWIALAAYVLGSLALNFTAFGRTVLAVGGGEDAARLMGLPVDRVKLSVYSLSGRLAGLAGVILAAQFGAGQPTEGVGWELFAIASVVVGGTLLTGGVGSVGATLAGRAPARAHLQHPELRERHGIRLLARPLAVGHPRRLPPARRHLAEPAGAARASARPARLGVTSRRSPELKRERTRSCQTYAPEDLAAPAKDLARAARGLRPV